MSPELPRQRGSRAGAAVADRPMTQPSAMPVTKCWQNANVVTVGSPIPRPIRNWNNTGTNSAAPARFHLARGLSPLRRQRCEVVSGGMSPRPISVVALILRRRQGSVREAILEESRRSRLRCIAAQVLRREEVLSAVGSVRDRPVRPHRRAGESDQGGVSVDSLHLQKEQTKNIVP